MYYMYSMLVIAIYKGKCHGLFSLITQKELGI